MFSLVLIVPPTSNNYSGLTTHQPRCQFFLFLEGLGGSDKLIRSASINYPLEVQLDVSAYYHSILPIFTGVSVSWDIVNQLLDGAGGDCQRALCY